LLRLGNDIVSLKQAGILNKSQHTRFVNRVFTPSEQFSIKNSVNPDITLWTMWAAKEAAYKVVSKKEAVPVFSHKKFEVKRIEPEESQEVQVYLNFSGNQYRGYAEICADYIHAYVSSDNFSKEEIIFGIHQISQEEKMLWQDEERWPSFFSPHEMDSIRHLESACIRNLCKKHVAHILNCDISRLQIIRPTLNGKSQPPFLLVDDRACQIDISLSHHENWLAWTVAISPEFHLPLS